MLKIQNTIQGKTSCHYFCLLVTVHVSYLTETAARDTLEEVMAEALSKSGSNWSTVHAVCLGVSGVNHPTDQERILNWLRFSPGYCLALFLFPVK
jgi:hypothetical protein